MSLIFHEDNTIFRKYTEKYITHERGLFILAPSGAGKTFFVNNQTDKHWIDGDTLWTETHAQSNDAWWTQGIEKIHEVDQRCDVITAEAKRLGLWVMGASCYWLIPDAVVLPDWKIHKEYIKSREEHHYDGGAKSEDHTQVLSHREWILNLAKENNVPILSTIEESVQILKNT